MGKKFTITIKILSFLLLFYLWGMETVPVLATSPEDIRPDEAAVTKALEDLNDGSVGIDDIAALARAYGLKPGKPGYQESLDLNLDSIIDLYDLVILAKKYLREKNVQYGVVTEILSFSNSDFYISEIKVLTENGKETVLDINKDAVKLLYKEDHHEMETGDLIKYTLDGNFCINNITLLARQTENHITIPLGPENYVDPDNSKYFGSIQNAVTEPDRLRFNDKWYYVTDDTKVFNGYGEINNDGNHQPCLINPKDIFNWLYEIGLSNSCYFQYINTNVTYIYFCHEIPLYHEDALAAVLDYYIDHNIPWVEIDINGEIHSYELSSQSYSPITGALYQYSINNNKFNLTGGDAVFDPDNETICSSAYGFVCDTSDNMININGVWYFLNENTVIYDYAPWYQDRAKPVFLNGISELAEGDLVWFKTWNGNSPYLKVLIVANDMKEHFDWNIPIPAENNYVLITDKYYRSGDLWVALDINGVIYSFEVGGTYEPIVGSLYRNYTFNEDKIIISASDFVFNPDDFKDGAVLSSDPGAYGSISGKVFAVVTDINESSNAVQINGVWYYTNEDTYIFDYSDWYNDGDEPEYLDRITDINKGNSIIFVSIPYQENVASLLLIVNNIPDVDLPAIIEGRYPDDYISNENKWDDVDTYDTIKKEDKLYPPIPSIFD